MTTLSQPWPAPAAVYLIHRKDRRRFKVGWSSHPVARAQALPEFQRFQLDLRSSLALWLPSRERAQEVERALHKSLAPYHSQADHHGAGHSEWFAPAALPAAIQLLRQMPGAASHAPAKQRLQPLLPELAAALCASSERSAQDAWYSVEDLWLRLAALMPVQVEDQGGVCQLRFSLPGAALGRELAELRLKALDIDIFSWRLSGESGAFVRLIADERDALVFTLAPLQSVNRWPEGDDLGWQVKGLIARMRALQRESLGVTS